MAECNIVSDKPVPGTKTYYKEETIRCRKRIKCCDPDSYTPGGRPDGETFETIPVDCAGEKRVGWYAETWVKTFSCFDECIGFTAPQEFYEKKGGPETLGECVADPCECPGGWVNC